jgi:hypothetical protein
MSAGDRKIAECTSMAISRIGGKALKANLERDSDLTFNTNTLAIDYTNGRIGIGKTNPTTDLDITGSTAISSTLTVGSQVDIDGIRILDNKIVATRSNDDIVLVASGTGNVNVNEHRIVNVTDPTQDQDAATKAYVDATMSAGAITTGMQITLGTPTDSSLTTDAMYKSFVTGTKVTDAIDDLNEAIQNVLNSTAVSNVDFTADVTSGGAGTVVTLTITADMILLGATVIPQQVQQTAHQVTLMLPT